MRIKLALYTHDCDDDPLVRTVNLGACPLPKSVVHLMIGKNDYPLELEVGPAELFRYTEDHIQVPVVDEEDYPMEDDVLAVYLESGWVRMSDEEEGLEGLDRTGIEVRELN